MELAYRSAFELGADIAAGKLSSVAVLDYFLGRIEQHNPRLNCVVAFDVDRARQRAEAADAAAARGENWGPLHGVPVTIKDAFSTEGLVTVGGIPECRNNIPGSNAVAVQRYVDAGAIVFAKTNVPFMSADLQSYNDVYGVTNNPWNIERTSGGSSGGAAAAVAAGLTPLELGSDIGGSIRTPSHFNGVFGHKSSYGVIPQRGHLPPGEHTLSETDIDVIGPIGTCVSDLRAAMNLLAGPLPEDAPAWSVSLPEPDFKSTEELRIAVWADDAECRVDKEIVGAIRQAAESLAQKGAKVDFNARPDFDVEMNRINYGLLLSAAIGSGMPDAVFDMAQDLVAEADPDDMSNAVVQLRGITLSHKRWLKENERRLKIRAAWSRFFEDYDVLFCPCAFTTAFPHDHEPDMHQRRIEVNGESRLYTDALWWAGLTINAYLPATAVPIGRSKDGLPIGMQVTGPYLGDMKTLAVAEMLEQHHRSFVPPADCAVG